MSIKGASRDLTPHNPEATTPTMDNILQQHGLPDEDLPAYPGSRGPNRRITQHAYHLRKDGKTWLTLNVASRAHSEKHIPSYIGSATMTGSVQLDLPKPEHLLGIGITVRFEQWTWIHEGKILKCRYTSSEEQS
jgi:hypothetical protein